MCYLIYIFFKADDYLYCDAHPEETINAIAALDPLTYSRRLGSSFNLTYECCERDFQADVESISLRQLRRLKI